VFWSNYRGKDLADLAFAGFSSHMREKMEGHGFTDVDQVLQRAVVHENRAWDNRSYSWFKDTGRDKDEQVVNLVDEESTDDGDAEICVVE
jgi:hypothetical protein